MFALSCGREGFRSVLMIKFIASKDNNDWNIDIACLKF